jgi:acetolactate synthase-1/3 small subunit
LHCNTADSESTSQVNGFIGIHYDAEGHGLMRHVISVLLQNEVGALTRMTGLFSTRGYNIDSLNVAPTDDPTVSRVTVVVSGSDAAIAQLNTQLAKLVDVLNIHDMTLGDHFERELVIVKIKLFTGGLVKAVALAKEYGADILDDSQSSCTIQLIGRISEVDAFVIAATGTGELQAVARSGSVAVSKGEVTLSSYAKHHLLTG